MSIPIKPSISPVHQFHHQIDQFLEDMDQAILSAQKNEGNVGREEVTKLATDIQRLEENANFVLRERGGDEETVIDAQIILNVITQGFTPPDMGDREVTMLRAARDYKEQSNSDLEEIIKTLSQYKEDREELLLTINQISHEVFLRCNEESASEEKKNA